MGKGEGERGKNSVGIVYAYQQKENAQRFRYNLSSEAPLPSPLPPASPPATFHATAEVSTQSEAGHFVEATSPASSTSNDG